MNIVKTSAIALSALVAATGSAFAFNEGTVNQTDIAHATTQVARIEDGTTRLQAQTLVDQAQSYIQDGDLSHAAVTLEQALDLASQSQVAESVD